MTKRDKVTAALPGGVVQRAAPELCAKRAWVRFLAHIEYDVAYVGPYYVKRHAYFARKILNRRKILIRYAKIEHHAANIKMPVAEALIKLQSVQQKKAVLPARYADAYFISFAYHVVSFVRTADTA